LKCSTGEKCTAQPGVRHNRELRYVPEAKRNMYNIIRPVQDPQDHTIKYLIERARVCAKSVSHRVLLLIVVLYMTVSRRPFLAPALNVCLRALRAILFYAGLATAKNKYCSAKFSS
jgi:hypothetical protein